MKDRTLYSKLVKHLGSKAYTILTGARQVGKTSLLKKLYYKLQRENEIVQFINLENKETLNSLNANPENVFKLINFVPRRILEGKSEKRVYFLIDEIQYLDDPTNFLKHLYDEYEYNVKIITTGSSAFYIDTKFSDSLAGRKRIFQLYPLSFNEFLEFKNQEALNSEISTMVSEPSYRSQYGLNINKLLDEYLVFGGYPAIVLEKDIQEKKWLLNELKNSYLRKDITDAGIEKEVKFMMMVKILASQIGNIVNKNEIANTIGLDNKTIEKYTHVLEKSFHIDMVKPYFRNLRKELTKMPKVFFNDVGLRNAILNRFDYPNYRDDKGALLENFIYTQLRHKHEPENIKYWRTTEQNEVDFVIEESFDQGYALEVKWECNNFSNTKYKKFVSAYPNFPLSCIDSNNKEILIY